MNEMIERRNGDMYAGFEPMPGSVMMALKNFFRGPSTMEAYMALRIEVLKTRKELRIAILNTAIELAKEECLSDEKFRLLMLAFSQQ